MLHHWEGCEGMLEAEASFGLGWAGFRQLGFFVENVKGASKADWASSRLFRVSYSA